jgi:hypothetical protein
MGDECNMTLNRIEQRFADRFLKYGGVLLLSKDDALQMVIACQAEGVRILGIDGFYLRGDTLQPSLEDSVDFSSTEQQASYLDSSFSNPVDFLRTRMIKSCSS